MRAIVLAAGEGSRLRPLTASKPKPMIRVGNKPILQYALEAIRENGVKDVTLVLGYHREKVQSYFEDGKRFGLRINYVFQEALLGTAHALSLVDFEEDDVLVLGGDNIVDARLVKEVLDAPPGLALAAKAAENPSKYGVLTLDRDAIQHIEEKPPETESEWVNTGVYRFTREFHSYLKEKVMSGITGITNVLQTAIDDGQTVRAVRSEGLWMDAIYPWDLLALNARLVLEPPSGQPPGVHASAVLEAPLRIGADVEVGPMTVVHPTTSIGDNVLVGAGCIIENCILMDDVQVGAGTILRNTVVAEGARIGPRVTTLSGACDVKVRDGWHQIADFGSVIGEDTVLEGAVTVRPGTLVGNRARVSARAFVQQNVEDESLVL